MKTIYLKREPGHGWLMLWHTRMGAKWYPIAYRKIEPIKNEPHDFFVAYRRSVNNVLAGFEEVFSGYYDAETRTLHLQARPDAVDMTKPPKADSEKTKAENAKA
jgi:hypothetical protein